MNAASSEIYTSILRLVCFATALVLMEFMELIQFCLLVFKIHFGYFQLGQN